MLAGFVGSLLGLGGGIIIVPALTLVYGVDMRFAIGASIITVIATSSGAAAAYVRDKITNIRVGMFLEMATTTGALTGAFLAGMFSNRVLEAIFAAMMVYSALMMLRRRKVELPEGVERTPLANKLKLHGEYYDQALKRLVHYNTTGVVPGLAVMFIAGIFSGLLGIGSGLFKVLGMDVFMKLPMKVSTATSNFMIGVTAAASAGVYFARGDVNPAIAAPVALGVLVGATLGTRVMTRMKNVTLRLTFVPILIYTAIEMAVKAYRG